MPSQPEFFDLQVNGYAGIDFNADSLSPEELATACERLRADGVTGILATLVTDDLQLMATRLRNLVEAREVVPLAQRMIAGIHLEGPFINATPGYVGAHKVDGVRPADVEAMKLLMDAGAGLVRLVTLAPENDAKLSVTRWLADQGACISAGHCNPTLEELRAAIDAGLSMFTHLGNAVPQMVPKHDNIMHRALHFADRLWICFIADGVHVPYIALRNYIKLVGIERTVIVSDAISAAGLGPGVHRFNEREVVVDEQLATWNATRAHLVGSAMPLPLVYPRLRDQLGLSAEDAHCVTNDNPRRAIGLN